MQILLLPREMRGQTTHEGVFVGRQAGQQSVHLAHLAAVPPAQQDIVGGHVINFAQLDQVMNGQLIRAALISGIHCLGRAQELCDLSLR